MLGDILIGLVVLIHLYFMYLEMVAWNRPLGRKTFKMTPEFSAASTALAANQGLYDGFLAAGLVWGLWFGPTGLSVKLFFLACVVIAGLFGAATVSRRILYVQALPAGLALSALWMGVVKGRRRNAGPIRPADGTGLRHLVVALIVDLPIWMPAAPRCGSGDARKRAMPVLQSQSAAIRKDVRRSIFGSC